MTAGRLAAALFGCLLSCSVVACKQDCPDDQDTAVVLRFLAPISQFDVTFDLDVIPPGPDTYVVADGEVPVITDLGEGLARHFEDVRFTSDGTTVLVSPRCDDACRRFLVRARFYDGTSPTPVGEAYLETGYRPGAFAEFRWLVPAQLVLRQAPCATCPAGETCRGTDSGFTPACRPIVVDRCRLPPLGSQLMEGEFEDADCRAQECP